MWENTLDILIYMYYTCMRFMHQVLMNTPSKLTWNCNMHKFLNGLSFCVFAIIIISWQIVWTLKKSMNLCIVIKLFELLKWTSIIYVFLWYFFSFVNLYIFILCIKTKEKTLKSCLVVLCEYLYFCFTVYVYLPNIKPFNVLICYLNSVHQYTDLDKGSGRVWSYWKI